MKTFTNICSAIVLLLLTCISARGDVSLPAILSDHAVLQKSAQTRIWGRAAPGEGVRVTLAGQQGQATAGADGNWQVTLDLTECGPGPVELVVAGKNTITVTDVLVGEVWVACGQSNMQSQLAGSLGCNEEFARSANPFLRQFEVQRVGSAKPLPDGGGRWTVAGPATAGGFTAVGYYFGKSVQHELKVPVGIVNASWDSSTVEAWTSAEALDQDAVLKADKDKWVTLAPRFADYVVRYRAWEKQYQRQDRPAPDTAAFAAPGVGTADWKPVTLPGSLVASGLPDAGVVWLRHKITIEPAQAGKDLSLSFGDLRLAQVFWDGAKIDEVAPDVLRDAMLWMPPWYFKVPANLVKAGDGTLAIRLFSPAGDAALTVDPKNPLLAGAWLGTAEYSLPALDAAAKAAYPGMPPVKGLSERLMPSYLFSGMITPLLPSTIKGVIWYQGEANAWDPATYPKKFALLVNGWRAQWQKGLPFYFCQLPTMGTPKTNALAESRLAEFREAQAATLALPQTGQAILADSADADLHPRNKKDPGERLARIALAQTYARKVVFAGPVYDSMKVEAGQVRLTFRCADGGLVAKPLPAETRCATSRSRPMWR